MIYTICSPDGMTEATISPELGGFVASLIFPFLSGRRETLFLHDNALDPGFIGLRGGVPFIFPICGRVTQGGREGVYVYDGKEYVLPIHGLSAYEKWEVLHHDKHSVELILKSNARTLSLYPFRFAVILKWRVENKKLMCHQQYRNLESEKVMPFYAGFHPYFLTPDVHAGKEKMMIDFKAVKRLKYNTTLTDVVGEQAMINTPISIMDPVVNEQLFLLGADTCARLSYPDGEALAMTASDDLFSYLQLYHESDQPFFCVEHWMGFPNAMNTGDVCWLNAGESKEAVYEIEMGL